MCISLCFYENQTASNLSWPEQYLPVFVIASHSTSFMFFFPFWSTDKRINCLKHYFFVQGKITIPDKKIPIVITSLITYNQKLLTFNNRNTLNGHMKIIMAQQSTNITVGKTSKFQQNGERRNYGLLEVHNPRGQIMATLPTFQHKMYLQVTNLFHFIQSAEMFSSHCLKVIHLWKLII